MCALDYVARRAEKNAYQADEYSTSTRLILEAPEESVQEQSSSELRAKYSS